MRLTIFLLILLYLNSSAQTSVFQDFEGAGTLGFTGGTINTEIARGGTKSLRLGRDQAAAGGCALGTDAAEVEFDPVFLVGSACPGIFTFYHSVRASSGGTCGSGRGMDTREGFAVYVKLNGATSWTLLNSFSAFANCDWNWVTSPGFVGCGGTAGSECGSLTFPNPFVYNVPGGTTIAQFKIITIGKNSGSCATFGAARSSAIGNLYDRGDEGFFIDDVSFSTTLPCVLPIELLDFYGTKNKSQNDITWKVAQEENIIYYVLEKSDNGIDFTDFSTVIPNNEVDLKNYTVIDDAPFNDITYYRLKTKEKNGNFTKYSIISVDEASKDWSYIQYQNLNNLVIEFKNNLPKNTSVEIIDLSGKQLINSTITQTQTLINTENLSAGIYFIRLSTAYKTEHFKIIISK